MSPGRSRRQRSASGGDTANTMSARAARRRSSARHPVGVDAEQVGTGDEVVGGPDDPVVGGAGVEDIWHPGDDRPDAPRPERPDRSPDRPPGQGVGERTDRRAGQAGGTLHAQHRDARRHEPEPGRLDILAPRHREHRVDEEHRDGSGERSREVLLRHVDAVPAAAPVQDDEVLPARSPSRHDGSRPRTPTLTQAPSCRPRHRRYRDPARRRARPATTRPGGAGPRRDPPRR